MPAPPDAAETHAAEMPALIEELAAQLDGAQRASSVPDTRTTADQK